MIILKRAIAFISSVVSLLTGYFGISGTGVHKKIDDFRVTSYVVADYIQNIEALHSEDFDIITDAIIFGAVTFDSEGNINLQKEKFEKAMHALLVKHDQYKQKQQEITNEFLIKKMDFERETNLLKQQIDFLHNKIEEMNNIMIGSEQVCE